MLHDVQIVVRGVGSADADQLEGLVDRIKLLLGAIDPAVIFWPVDKEIGACFQIKEEVLGELLQPITASSLA